MMFVGYPFNCESDSIRMWNMEMNRIFLMWDVIWLKRMFFEQENISDAIELDAEGIADEVRCTKQKRCQ